MKIYANWMCEVSVCLETLPSTREFDARFDDSGFCSLCFDSQETETAELTRRCRWRCRGTGPSDSISAELRGKYIFCRNNYEIH